MPPQTNTNSSIPVQGAPPTSSGGGEVVQPTEQATPQQSALAGQQSLSDESIGGSNFNPGSNIASSAPQPASRSLFIRLLSRADILLALLLVLGALGLFWSLNREGRNGSPTAQSIAEQYGAVTLPLQDFVATDTGEIDFTSQQVVINGELQTNGQLFVNDSLTISPSSQPLNPNAGQIYYDQTSNVLAYYNGAEFVSVEAAPEAGAAGVTSLNGLDGAVSINNSSAAGASITIDDASTSAKGIAQFNGTNFAVSGGIVNTTQNINTAATPTFAGVNTNVIQGGASLSLLSGGNVVVGASNATGTLLVVDTKTTAGDPTGVDGAIYYNSATGDFRCFQGGSWVDCITASGGFVSLQNAYDNGNTITTTDARDVSVTLADTATDSNFLVNIATGSTGRFAVQDNGTDVMGVTPSAVTLGTDVDLLLQGDSAYISNPHTQSGSEVFGLNASVDGANSVAVGNGASGGTQGVSVGQGADSGGNGVAIGQGASTGSGIAIGQDTSTSGASIALGRGAAALAANQLVIGDSSHGAFHIDDVYIGNGVTNATPVGFTLNATGGNGTDIAGAALNIAGGRGTGSAAGGNVNIQASAAGSSGSSLNPLETVATFSPTSLTMATDVDILMQGASAFISNPMNQTSSEGFGLNVTMSGVEAVAFGNGAIACNQSVAIGFSAETINCGSGGIAIGHNAGTNGGSVAIGQSAGTGVNGVAVGSNATSSGDGVAIGFGAAGSSNAVTIGAGSDNSAGGIAIGDEASVSTNNSIALGINSSVGANANDTIVIGEGATAGGSAQSNHLVVGGNNMSIQQGFIGNGITNATPNDFALNATGGSGTDIAGADLNLAGGKGTGSANGGDVNFRVTFGGQSSGTTLRTLQTVGTFSGVDGSFTLQNAVDSTTAFEVLNQAGTISVLSVDTSTPGIQLNGAGTDNTEAAITFGTGLHAPSIRSLDDADVPWFGEDTLSLSVAGMQIHSTADDPLTDQPLFQMDGFNGRFTFRNGSDDFGFLQYVDTNDNTTFGISNNFGDGEATFQNIDDSTVAFRVLNAGTVPQFVVDTSNSRVYIGNPTADNTGALLVLDTKDTSGDPTGVNGGMYYNSNRGTFRCYENDYWRDCMQSARTSWNYTNELLSNFDDGVLEAFGTNGLLSAETGHPGILEISAASTSSDAGVENFVNGDGDLNILLGNGDYWRHETVARVPVLSNNDASNTFTFRTGFNDDLNNAEDGTDGCYFRYSHDINAGEWQGYCVSASTSSTCDTDIVVTADQWYRLTVVVNSAGTSADFLVDGVSECQVTTNIPTGSGEQTTSITAIHKDDGDGSARTIDLDYISMEAQFGTPR